MLSVWTKLKFCHLVNCKDFTFEHLSNTKFFSIEIRTKCLQSQILSFNPLPDDIILDRSKLKQSADDNFKFDKKSRKFSKRVGNNMGKGEIAHYEQISPFPTLFSKGASKGVIVWE